MNPPAIIRLFVLFVLALILPATRANSVVPIPYNLSAICAEKENNKIENLAVFLDYDAVSFTGRNYDGFLTEQYIRDQIEKAFQKNLSPCVDLKTQNRIHYPTHLSDPIFESPDTISVYLRVYIRQAMNQEQWSVTYFYYRNSHENFENIGKIINESDNKSNFTWDLDVNNTRKKQKAFDRILAHIFPAAFY